MGIRKKIVGYFRRKRLYDIILKSGYFNSTWYLKQYPEILQKGLKPLEHYLEIGWKEGKNPSNLFDNDVYLAIHEDIRNGNINPLVHYIMHGKYENRESYSVDYINAHQVKESDVDYVKNKNMDSKTILLISHELSLTGAPRALLNMAIALRKLGAKPVILSLRGGPLEKEINDSGVKLIVEFFLKQKLNVKQKCMTNFLLGFDSILLNTLDTIHLIECFTTFPGTKICWLHEGYISFDYWRQILNLTNLFSLFDKIFVVGEYSKSITLGYVSDISKLNVLLYGIPEMQLFPAKKKTNEKVNFLLPGMLSVRKGQLILLKSLEYLSEEVRDQIMIFFVGPIGEIEILKTLKTSSYSCVKYLGEYDHTKLMHFFCGMDVVLIPSLDDPMPIVGTEAMILEKTIVVSDHTGTASFIKDGVNGYKIPASNPEALAKVIENIVRSQEFLPYIGKAGKEIYDNNFTLEIFEQNVKKQLIED